VEGDDHDVEISPERRGSIPKARSSAAQPTGIIPAFQRELARKGIDLPVETFTLAGTQKRG
jgi:hypothetical protein